MSEERCFLCAVTITEPDYEIIESCKVPSSQKPLQSVLQHLANCIKTKLVFQEGASVCASCFEELTEYDTLMLNLLKFQRKLTQQLQTVLSSHEENEIQEKFEGFEMEIEQDENMSDNFNSDLDGKVEVEVEELGIEVDGGFVVEEITEDCEDDDDFEEGSVSSGRRKNRKEPECVICGTSFKSRTLLQNHITEVHDPKVYTCNICGVIRRDEEYLELHMNIHEGKSENECRYCGKTFSRPVNTIRHMRKHWDKKKYQCEKCGERFSLDNMLYNHRLRHEAEENPLICSQCNQTFKSRKTFNHHILIHQENRPRHHCTLCTKSFTERYTLKMHMKTHGDIEQINAVHLPAKKEQQETIAAVTGLIGINPDDHSCVICAVKYESKELLEDHLQNDHDVILK